MLGAKAAALIGGTMQLDDEPNWPLGAPKSGAAAGYDLVCRVIAQFAARPGAMEDIAAEFGMSPGEIERAIHAWCGLSPASFAEAMTVEHIRGRFARDGAWPVGGGRVQAFEVQIVASITDEARRSGTGMDIAYGFHASPFGGALLLTAEGALCGLAFVDDHGGYDRQAALDDMAARWPRARFREAHRDTEKLAARIFAEPGAVDGVVPLVLIGTPFDLAVWRALLQIPIGQLVSYTQIARHLGRPSASRAVGTANGRNPISFVVPCHRALRGDGSLGGYYWGLTRKRAMIAWENGRALSV